MDKPTHFHPRDMEERWRKRYLGKISMLIIDIILLWK
jgi:hypothetical protein